MKLIKCTILVSIVALFTASLLPMDPPKEFLKKQGKKIRRAAQSVQQRGQRAVQWVENTGQIVLGNLTPTMQSLTNKDFMNLFVHLPKDIQRLILHVLIDVYDAADLSNAARAITDLSLINNDLFGLINQPTFHSSLVNHLSQKFDVRKAVVAQNLRTEAAKYQLEKHKEMMNKIENFLTSKSKSKKKAAFEELKDFFAQNVFGINAIIVNQQGIDGILPLSRAVIEEELSLVQLLMQNGADPMQLTTINKRTPFILAAINANTSEKIRDIVSFMIPALQPGQIDQLDAQEMNALSYAVKNQDIPTIKILLDADADPEGIPLAVAESIGNQAIIDLLQNAMKK